jgi:hypothetical protein
MFQSTTPGHGSCVEMPNSFSSEASFCILLSFVRIFHMPTDVQKCVAI